MQTSFSWGGPIFGEDPTFTATGTATFDISGSTLTLILTNTSTDTIEASGQVLTGLTWDITDTGVSLTPGTAVMGSQSIQIGSNTTSDTDLSSEWAFRDDISAGSSLVGPLGAYGVGAMGDINLGADTFGPNDRFDTTTNIWRPPSGSLNGIEPGLVGQNIDLTKNGLPKADALVQDTMVFTFNIAAGTLTTDEITNAQALFGTDGAYIIPEPASVVIWCLLVNVGACVGWRRMRGR